MPRAAPKNVKKPSTKQPYSTATKLTSTHPKSRTGKDSHLYTDDNPSTTLHGTGFKDAATAGNTITLVSNRSLTYQFQTINTMFYRAKHHPNSQNNQNMQAAMAIFRVWLDETYPATKRAQRDFKPVLSREVVGSLLSQIRAVEGSETRWAEKYVTLPRGKRLANTLMDDAEPREADLERYRLDRLVELTEERKAGDGEEVFWRDGVEGNGLSDWHLRCVSFAWSPVGEARLKKAL